MESGKTYIVEVKEEHMIDSEVVKKSRATKEITSPQSNLWYFLISYDIIK